jgi:hypothetical protein
VISVSPVQLSFQVVLNGAPTPNQTLVVQNAGHGTLNYSVGYTLAAIQVSGSPHPLDAGASDNLTVSVNTSGLAAGQYDGTITISDANALNSPVFLSVHVSVITGIAAVNPTSLSVTAQQGDTPQSSFSVTNAGQPGTFLHYAIYASDGSRFTLQGSPTVLAAGRSDSFTLGTKTSDLAPSSTPYVYQLLVTNLDLPQTDPHRVTYVTVSVTVTRPPARIAVNPGSLTFTTMVGQNPPDAQLNIANSGPSGSILNWTVTSRSNRFSTSGGLTIFGGYSQTVSIHYIAYDLAASTYNDTLVIHCTDDPRVPDVTIPVTINVLANQQVYRGAFSGFVQDVAEANDPGSPFRDNNYGGPATFTVKASASGGFDIFLNATVNQSFVTAESFSIGTLQQSWHATQLAGWSFSFDVWMNDHVYMHAVGSLIGTTIQGTWTMIQTNSSDQSDSGGGSFYCVLQ